MPRARTTTHYSQNYQKTIKNRKGLTFNKKSWSFHQGLKFGRSEEEKEFLVLFIRLLKKWFKILGGFLK
jgi:hypothetical protein